MAKGNNPLVDGFSGSIGQQTLVPQPNNTSVMKKKITEMTNPRTPGQVAQRGSFALAVKLASTLKLFLRTYFKKTSVIRSSYNSFVKALFDTSSNGTVFLTSQGLKDSPFTNGDLYPFTPVWDGAAPDDEGGGAKSVSFTWPYDANSEIQDGADNIHALILDTDSLDYQVISTGDTRGDQTSSVIVPNSTGNNKIVVLFARNGSTGEVSSNSPVVGISAAGAGEDLTV